MPLGRVIASAQGATRGFAGGSVTLEFNRASAQSVQGEGDGAGQAQPLFVLLGLVSAARWVARLPGRQAQAIAPTKKTNMASSTQLSAISRKM